MPGAPGRWIKASLRGAFFVAALVVALAAGPGRADCPADRSDEPVRVQHVYDGDSLTLADGRRVRLIGINTPERGRDGARDQPLALAARDRLRQMLFATGMRARLRYGSQRRDRHDRLLAHLFLPDGRNAAAVLLEAGLGWHVAIPPNLWSLDCYAGAEARARAARRGVWGRPEYRPLDAARLDLRREGFALVQGVLRQVRDRRGRRHLRIGRLRADIPLAELSYFPDPPGRHWIGRRLELRGWLWRARGEMRVMLHHPAMLRRLDTGNRPPQKPSVQP